MWWQDRSSEVLKTRPEIRVSRQTFMRFKTGRKGQVFMMRWDCMEESMFSWQVKTRCKSQVFLKRPDLMEYSKLHDNEKTKQGGLVKSSWQDEIWWKGYSCMTSQDWKEESGLREEISLNGRVGFSWQASTGCILYSMIQDFMTIQGRKEESGLD